MKQTLLSMLLSVLFVGCGSGTNPTNNNPGGNPGGGANPDAGNPGAGGVCAATWSGDADSGVALTTTTSATYKCTSAYGGTSETLEVVEADGSRGFIVTISYINTSDSVPKDTVQFSVLFQPALTPVLGVDYSSPGNFDSCDLCGVAAGLFEIRGPVFQPTFAGEWAAIKDDSTLKGGSVTFRLTSETSTALAKCTLGGVAPAGCFVVHGTLHGFLVPKLSYSGNGTPFTPPGTVTLDATF